MRRTPALAAAVAVAASFAMMIGLCLVLWRTGDVPDAVVWLGRLLPGVASLLAVVLVLGPRSLLDVWRLRPTTVRELATSYGLALVVMLPTLALPAVAGVLVGATAQPGEFLLSALPVVLVGTAVFALSTVGEEVLWRGQLQSALERLGFWWSAVVVAVLWTAFHVPLHLTYVLQDALTTRQAVAATLTIAAWAPLLAALVEYRGTLWPAVFAHAVPLSSLQLLTPATAQGDVPFWTVTVLGWAAMLTAAVVVRRQPRPTRSQGPDGSPGSALRVHHSARQASPS